MSGVACIALTRTFSFTWYLAAVLLRSLGWLVPLWPCDARAWFGAHAMQHTNLATRDANGRGTRAPRAAGDDAAAGIVAGDTHGDWVAVADPDSGAIYFVNKVTHESSWDRPDGWPEPAHADAAHDDASAPPHVDGDAVDAAGPGAATAAEEGAADDGIEWLALVDDESGQMYYYNKRTGERSWSDPRGNVVEDAVGAGACARPRGPFPAPSAPTALPDCVGMWVRVRRRQRRRPGRGRRGRRRLRPRPRLGERRRRARARRGRAGAPPAPPPRPLPRSILHTLTRAVRAFRSRRAGRGRGGVDGADGPRLGRRLLLPPGHRRGDVGAPRGLRPRQGAQDGPPRVHDARHAGGRGGRAVAASAPRARLPCRQAARLRGARTAAACACAPRPPSSHIARPCVVPPRCVCVRARRRQAWRRRCRPTRRRCCRRAAAGCCCATWSTRCAPTPSTRASSPSTPTPTLR